MMASCSDYTTWLAAAETALQARLTGKTVIAMRHGEKSIDYASISVPDLQARIAFLQTKVDACNGLTTNRRRILRVMPIG